MPMSLPHTGNGKSYLETPQTVLLLQKLSGPEGSISAHVPFTINDIQQCREKLGRYNENPDKFIIYNQVPDPGK
jgi:hypothetical protein